MSDDVRFKGSYEGMGEKVTGIKEIEELTGVLTGPSLWTLSHDRGADGGPDGEGGCSTHQYTMSLHDCSRGGVEVGAGKRCPQLCPSKKLKEEARDAAGR